jgi:hypothetical protein
MEHSANTLTKERAGMATLDQARRAKRIWLKYLGFVALYALIFGLWQAEPVPMPVHAAGVLVAALSAFPLARWYAKGKLGLPMFELICLAYGLQFSTPLYFQLNQAIMRDGRAVVLLWEQTLRALLITALGLSSLIGMYYLTSASKLARSMPKLNLPIGGQHRLIYSGMLLTAGLAIVFLRVLNLTPLLDSRLGAFITLISSQSYIAIALLAYQVYEAKDSVAKARILLYSSVAAAALLGFTTGSLESAFIPIVILLAVRWQMTKKTPWRLLAAGALVFIFIFQPVKGRYREQAWYGIETPGLIERVEIWLKLSSDMALNLFEGDFWEEGSRILRRSMSRLDLLHQLVIVQEMTPSTIPYYQGETYGYLAYSWVPRALWPDKPIAQEANIIFALDYGFLLDSQIDKTMMGISHIAEAYANFGVWGVAIIMGIQGLILALMDLMLNSSGSEGGRAIYLSIMVFFLNGIGSATAGIYGALVQNVAASALILWLLRVIYRVQPGRRSQYIQPLGSKKVSA